MFNIFKKKEKVVVEKPVQIKIEDCVDMSQTPEQYHKYKDEIVLPLVEVLRKICVLEENCMKQNEILDANKKKQGLPESQVADGWVEMMNQYKVDYGKVVEPICTEKLLKRGYAGSYGQPAQYAYINTGCEMYFIMKSSKKAIVETHFPHGIKMKHQFVFRNVDGQWLIDEKKYGFDTDWHVAGI
ncbi:MAG: hypothetical protein RR630_02445 [Coprobacillus sp.]